MKPAQVSIFCHLQMMDHETGFYLPQLKHLNAYENEIFYHSNNSPLL